MKILKKTWILGMILIWQLGLVAQSTNYYIDGVNGNDNHNGTLNQPWQTLTKVSTTTFLPGDHIFFKRGTNYDGCVTINGNGTAHQPITISAYGVGPAPRFTNPNYTVCTGNAMRIRGDYQIVEHLYFHHTAAAPSGEVTFEEIWEVGALHIGLGNDHVIVRNNEFAHNAKAIQSYSQHSLITRNYIHDVHTDQQNGFLSEPYWGPIGIHLGIGNQEVAYNTIENMYAVGGAFTADGGAIEVDDGRRHKDNIHIHHNTTYHNMGFLEVSYWDDIAFRTSSNIVVEYNVSRDYQSFLLWWAPTTNSVVKNNTIIRDDNEVEGNWNAVFILDEPTGDIDLTKNIVVVDNDQTEAIFIQDFNGAIHDVNHADNCYWNVAGGNIDLGLPFGSGEMTTNPLFVDYSSENYTLQPNSPTVGWGAFPSPPITLKIKVLLEGAYEDNGDMNTHLLAHNMLPNTQPYSSSPWQYTGLENVFSTTLSNVTDWILVELLDDNYNWLASRAVFVDKSGNLMDTDGTMGVSFNGFSPTNTYHILLRHRNHLAVVSSSPLSANNSLPHDFTNPALVLGGTSQLSNLGDGRYGLCVGDLDGSGIISVADFNGYITNLATMHTYTPADFDLDGQVTVSDFNQYLPNVSKIGVWRVRY